MSKKARRSVTVTNRHKIERNKLKAKLKCKRTEKVTECKRFIKNLSDYKMSDVEYTALGRGLNYIPTPSRPKPKDLMLDTSKYVRRMRINYIMHDKDSDEFIHPFRTPSKWVPKTSGNTFLEEYLSEKLLNSSYQKSKRIKSQIT